MEVDWNGDNEESADFYIDFVNNVEDSEGNIIENGYKKPPPSIKRLPSIKFKKF